MSVTALEIQRRELVLNGRAFGSAGAYEKILGTLRVAVDPTTEEEARRRPSGRECFHDADR
jgi:hypothetical protein